MQTEIRLVHSNLIGDSEYTRIWFEYDDEGFDYITKVARREDTTFRFGGNMITEQVDAPTDTWACSESFKIFIKLLRQQYKTLKWALDVDRQLERHANDPICTEIILRLPMIGLMSFHAVTTIQQYMPDECTIIKENGKVTYWRCWWD